MNIEAGVFEIGAIRKASMRRLLTALLGLAAGYFVFALAGYCAIEFYSNNGFDRSLEALMTAAFAVGPAGALIGLVGGLIFGGRFSRHLPRRACLAASCASVRLQRVIPKALISDSRVFRIWQCDDSMARGGFALCPHL
jgi:hypothetical protein